MYRGMKCLNRLDKNRKYLVHIPKDYFLQINRGMEEFAVHVNGKIKGQSPGHLMETRGLFYELPKKGVQRKTRECRRPF